MNKIEISGILIISLLFITLGFVAYNSVQIPQHRIFGLVLISITFFMSMSLNYYNWLPLRAGPVFHTLSHLVGRQLGQRAPLPGGREKARVAFCKRDVSHITKVMEQQLGGMWWLRGLLTGTIVIEVVGEKYKFKEGDQNDCENFDGGVFFEGRVDGSDVRNPDILCRHAEMERLQTTLIRHNTIFKRFYSQIENLQKRDYKDVESISNKLKVIAENMKNIHFHMGRGGAGGGFESMASEMGN